MSVLNTMLKDLDKRQQSHGVDELPVLEIQYLAPAAHKLPWILLILVSGGLLLGAGLAWQRFDLLQRDNLQLTQTIAQAEQPTVTALTSTEGERFSTTFSENIGEKQVMAADADISIASDSDEPQQTANVREPQTTDFAEPLTVKTPLQTPAITVDAANIAKQETSPRDADPLVSVETETRTKASSDTAMSTGTMAITEVRLSPSELAQKRFALGQAAQNEGRRQQAQAYLSEAIKLNPALHEARQHLAALYYGQGMFTEAESLLAQGLILYPQEYDYALLQARVYDAAGLVDRALAALTQIPDSHILAKQKWVMQSHLAQQSQAFELAEQSYRHLARIEPSQAKWWMGLAYALDSQSQFSAAKQAYQQALAQQGLSNQAIEFIDSRLAQLGEIE